MKPYHTLFAGLLALCILCSCEDDNNSWADNYQMDLMDFVTDATGAAVQAINDEGELLTIDNPVKGLKNDTTYRFVAIYTRKEQHINISQCSQAIAPRPVTMAEDSIYCDPVSIQSVWKTNNYINATLLIPNKDKKHVIGFVEKSITTNSMGQKIAHIQLYHDSKQDIAAFNSTAYVSLPLRAYADTLTRGQDSIYLSIKTIGKNKTFTYQY